MGCDIKFLRWLSETGRLPRNGTLLDIGESCLLGATVDDLHYFFDKHGCHVPLNQLDQTVEEFCYRSNLMGHPTIPTLFLAELMKLTDVRYSSIDVVSYGYADLFDLNRHNLSQDFFNYFDLILNLGTTEHLMNQYNAFKVMHHACKIDGHIFHQVPSTGYINHGYFAYNALMFDELAQANQYSIEDLWFYGPSGSGSVLVNSDKFPNVVNASRLQNNVDGFRQSPIPNSLINVLFCKKVDGPFRVGLELKTAAANLQNAQQFTSKFIDVNDRDEVDIEKIVPTQQVIVQPEEVTVTPSINLHDLEVQLAGIFQQWSDIKHYDIDHGYHAQVHFDAGCKSEADGHLAEAICSYARSLALNHRFAPSVHQLSLLSHRIYTQVQDLLNISQTPESTTRALVRAVEYSPTHPGLLAQLERQLQNNSEFDLTQQCYVYPDPQRGKRIYYEAFLRAWEYVASAGLIGDFLEFGVLGGFTAKLNAKIMRDQFQLRNMYLFDSFEGLPSFESEIDRSGYDIAMRDVWSGNMKFTDDYIEKVGGSIPQHIRNRIADVISPERIHIIEGFYSESLQKPLSIKACLIHLDCDLYQSTVEVFDALHRDQVIQDGCVLMFDDFNCFKASPDFGQRRAFADFLAKHDQYSASPWFSYGFNGAAYHIHLRS